MKKTTTRTANGKLALRRETLRALDSLTLEQLAHAAGGATAPMRPTTLSTGSKFC